MLRLHLQKLGSILGLLAILMAMLAPTVSQALSSHDRLDAALAEHCSALQSVGDTDPLNPVNPHPLTFHWQACGYCGLLAHFPVLPPAAIVFATPAAFAHSVAVQPNTSTHLARPIASAQPRAPPVVL